MYYFLDEDGVIIGSGTEKHAAYKNVEAAKVDIPNGQSPYGYALKNGKFEPSEGMKAAAKAEQKAQIKALKEEEIANIVVRTKNGRKFKGDEKSQSRMSLALERARRLGFEALEWKLAGGEIELVTHEELEEALNLAVAKTSEIELCR